MQSAVIKYIPIWLIISYYYNFTDSKPNICDLLTLSSKDDKPLNVFKKIANSQYENLGMILLSDENGDIVESIKKEKSDSNIEQITMAIIKKWIDVGGSQCTYAYLLDSLKKAELGGLAEDIEDALKQGKLSRILIIILHFTI